MTRRARVTTAVLICTLTVLTILPSGCVWLSGSSLYQSMLLGGLVGGIIGHQSDHTGEGILVGAAITGTGELLKQMERHDREKRRESCEDADDEDDGRCKEPCERPSPCESADAEVQTQPQQTADTADQPAGDIVVIEVTNSNGSFMPVELKKKGDYWVGLKGEHYRELPSEDQLRLLYGL